MPSNDVITICKTTEKVLRSTPNLTLHDNHKLDLMNIILQKYFNIRLYHKAKSSNDSVQRIRTFHNRLVVLKNQ